MQLLRQVQSIARARAKKVHRCHLVKEDLLPEPRGPHQGPSSGEENSNSQSVQAEDAAPKKGKPAPPKGGPKGKAAGKGKTALPDVDPGPEPPKHLVGKKFHWTNVVGTRFAGSMFQQIVESLNSNKAEHVEAEPEDQADTKQEPERKPKMHTLLEKLTGTFFQE